MVELLNHIARLWWDWTASMFWQVGLLILAIALPRKSATQRLSSASHCNPSTLWSS